MEQFVLLQFAFLFGLSLIFSVISLARETMISFLVAGICWLATGLVNFILDPTTTLSVALSYLFIALGVIFMAASFKAIGESVMERKARKVEL